MKQLLCDVAEFHEGFGAPCHAKLLEQVPEDRQRLRLRCITEEFGELLEGHGIEGHEHLIEQLQELIQKSTPKLDHVKTADALVDLMYFCVGTGLEYGQPLDQVWDEVHKSNMAKFPEGKTVFDDLGKLLKPEGWKKPDIEASLTRATEAGWAYNDEAWKNAKPTISLDFDGVLHEYTSPWTREDKINDPPTKGALEAVTAYLEAGFALVISSCRASSPRGRRAIEAWLRQYGFPEIPVTYEKPHAGVYVDDRAYHFTGKNFPTPEDIREFRPWNRQRSKQR